MTKKEKHTVIVDKETHDKILELKFIEKKTISKILNTAVDIYFKDTKNTRSKK